jgi:succinoglycan biosynthesis transport protein ExoP
VELRDYWRLLIRYLPTVIVSVIVGVAAAAAVTFTATPQYEASAQIFISTPAAALDISALAVGSSFSQQRVKSYSQIINGPATLGPVIKKLNLDTTPTNLAKRITASAPLDTVLITVKVRDTSAHLAAKIANAVTAQFAKTVDTLEIASAGGGSPVKVSTVKSAVPPSYPASPKKALNLMLGLILGFGLGLGIATLRQLFDNTVKNEEQLQGLPLLTAIGFDDEAVKKPLVTQIGRYSSRAEAFRQLRTNLQFIRSENPPRVIAVSSALPGEGKTTTSINLAITLSQAGFKVVLVEADLRRPKIATYFPEAKGSEGLSELLSGRVKFSSVEALKESLLTWGNEGLRVIPSGAIPPNPAELLNSVRMDKVLAALRESFDYVIIDTAPLLPVTDAAVVASKCDGVVLTTRAGVTKNAEFKGAVEAITAVGSTVFGVVLNMIPHQRGSGEYGYRYGSSKYYGSRKYRPYSGKYAPAGKYAPSSTYAPHIE